MPSQPFSPGSEYFERRALAMPALDSERLFGRIVAESFPGIALLDEDMRPAAYDALVDTYLMRNNRDLTQVTNELKFRRFLVGAASLTGRSLVYAELARIADVDQKTAKAWLALLTNSYLVNIRTVCE